MPPAPAPPTAAFEFAPDNPAVAASANTVFFTDASDDDRDGGEIRAWAWDFGDPASGAANTSTDVNPSHTYAQPGNYRVTLTVTDDRGHSATSSQVLTVAP